MLEYKRLCRHVLQNGTWKQNRTGVDTLSCFNYNYSIDISQRGFPLLTTKRVNWKNIVIENLWFLRREGGNSSPDFLHKHGIHFWDSWIEEDGNLPEAYGQYWRWYPDYWHRAGDSMFFDQFKAIIDALQKDPFSRRLVLTNWFPPSAWTAKLPPCHLMAIFNVQWKWDDTTRMHRLNLHLTQRSCDIPVGVPFNIAGYAFLLSLVAHLTRLAPAQFAHTLVDAHIYKDQVDPLIGQLDRDVRELPTLHISDRITTLQDLDELIKDGTTNEIMDTFQLLNYDPHPSIRFPVQV